MFGATTEFLGFDGWEEEEGGWWCGRRRRRRRG